MNFYSPILGYEESRTKQKNRMKILKSAFELVIRDGIHFVTVQEIVDHADVTFRTFYNYYDHIYEIYVDLEILCLEEMKQSSDMNLTTGTGLEQTLSLLKGLKNWLEDHVDITKYLVLFDYDFQTKYSIQKVKEYLDGALFWKPLIKAVTTGVEDGSIIQEDPIKLTFTVLNTTYSMMQKYLYYHNLKNIGYEDIYNGDLDLMFLLLERSIRK